MHLKITSNDDNIIQPVTAWDSFLFNYQTDGPRIIIDATYLFDDSRNTTFIHNELYQKLYYTEIIIIWLLSLINSPFQFILIM